MEHKLDTLITLLEEEQASLNNRIEECLKDFEGPDFLLAGYHQKALFKTQRILRILYNLKDPLFDEKKWKINNIRHLEKEIANPSEAFLVNYWKERLEKYMAELEALNALPKPVGFDNPGNLVGETVELLVQVKIRKFKLVFNKSDFIMLQFSSTKKAVKIILPRLQHHLKHHTFHHSEIKSLLANGFVSSNNNRLELVLVNRGMETANEIMSLLSRITFETFQGVDKSDSYIEYPGS